MLAVPVQRGPLLLRPIRQPMLLPGIDGRHHRSIDLDHRFRCLALVTPQSGAHSVNRDPGSQAPAQRQRVQFPRMSAGALRHDGVALVQRGDGSRPRNFDFLELMGHWRIVAERTGRPANPVRRHWMRLPDRETTFSASPTRKPSGRSNICARCPPTTGPRSACDPCHCQRCGCLGA